MTALTRRRWPKLRASGLATVVLLSLTACLMACQGPQGSKPTAAISTEPASLIANDTVVSGTYDTYKPQTGSAGDAGVAIEGSEEEQLQQERIAGGAVGAVVSKNLEPLVGITDPANPSTDLSFGMNFQAPAQGHGNNGADCLSCHSAGKTGKAQPVSHGNAALSNADCASCHALP